jgi:phosphatidylglycerophosphatase A
MRLSHPRWAGVLPTWFVVTFATLGPLGRQLTAPGTWGTLAGVLYFLVFFPRLGIGGNLLVTAIASYFAVGICGEAEKRLRKKDPGEVVLDEVVAVPLCFLGWHALIAVWPVWVVLLAGFGLFRLFDILKPFGIRRLQWLPGGWGVVIDDLAAALMACGTLHVAAWLWTLR